MCRETAVREFHNQLRREARQSDAAGAEGPKRAIGGSSSLCIEYGPRGAPLGAFGSPFFPLALPPRADAPVPGRFAPDGDPSRFAPSAVPVPAGAGDGAAPPALPAVPGAIIAANAAPAVLCD